jgi:hypothetical protein
VKFAFNDIVKVTGGRVQGAAVNSEAGIDMDSAAGAENVIRSEELV